MSYIYIYTHTHIFKIYCMFYPNIYQTAKLTGHKRPSYLLLGSKMAPSHHHCTCTLPAKPALASHDTSATTVVCMCFHAIKGSGHSNLPELLHDAYISPSCVGAPFLFCILHAQDPTIQMQDTKLLSFFSFGSYIIWNSLPLDLRHCSTFLPFQTNFKPSSFCNTCTQLKLRPMSFSSSLCVVSRMKVCIEPPPPPPLAI